MKSHVFEKKTLTEKKCKVKKILTKTIFLQERIP